MDSHTVHILAFPCLCNPLHRSWIQHNIPAMHQLPRRYLRNLCRQCGVSKYLPEEHHGCRLAYSSAANVPPPWCRTCYVDSGRRGYDRDTCSVCVHEVWLGIEKEVVLCSCA